MRSAPLVVSKYVANREKDCVFYCNALQHGIVAPAISIERVNTLDLDSQRIASIFMRSNATRARRTSRPESDPNARPLWDSEIGRSRCQLLRGQRLAPLTREVGLPRTEVRVSLR
jgi:hypothetical protein